MSGRPTATGASKDRSKAEPRHVELKRKRIEHYREIAGDDAIAELRELAHPLRGLRVLELSSTATGGGVAEMLSSLVPLERDLGIAAEWRIIAGDPRFFEVTKKIHNGLQGMPVDLADDERRAYLDLNEATALSLAYEWDVVIVHDPQPAPIRSFVPEAGGHWIWRCHVDTSSAHQPVWEFMRPFVDMHDLAAFTLDSFVPAGLKIPTLAVLPAIDPLNSKNRPIPAYLARETVSEVGIDLSRPLMLQVSRFDPWKDPLGVVEVWRRLRADFPELQLALVGSMATDDPEGWRVYDEIAEETRDEPACFLFTNQIGVTAHEVNAFQRVADVVLQKSTREGFGLIVSETMWKGTPMVAGRAGGIPAQLRDGVGGYLATTIDEFAERVPELLADPVAAREIGARGIRRVRECFLLPRLLRDHVTLLRDAADRRKRQGRARYRPVWSIAAASTLGCCDVEVVRANELEIAYERVGKGQPLVFVHGAAEDHRVWQPQLAGLADEFTVVAWDEPGAGGSSDLPTDFGLADYADCLAALVETLALGPAHVAGLSWGGTVVQELYRRHPRLVATLILVDTYAGWRGSLPEDEVRARVEGVRQMLAAPADEFDPTLPGLFAGEPPAEFVPLLEQMAADVRSDSLGTQLSVMADADQRDLLPRITVPTLLIWGEVDARSPLGVARQFEQAIPDATLVVIGAAGHLSNLERPERFNKAVREFCLAHSPA